MSEAAERRVFNGDLLRASLFADGGERKLYVTFRHRLNDPGAFGPAQPVARARALGHAHLYIQSRRNDWFINPETRDLEAALAPLAARYDLRRATGFSMGGFGALRLAGVLGLQQVLLISPQWTIDPALVPWDPRYRADSVGFDPALGALDPLPGLAGCVLFDPARPLDLRHAREIGQRFPGLALCRLGFGGHPASQVIGDGLGIHHLTGLILTDALTPAAVRALHRRARRNSAKYTAFRARALDARRRRG